MPGSVGHEAINMNKIGQTLPDWHLLAPHCPLPPGGAWRRAVRMLGTDARLRRVNTLTGEVLTAHPGSKET